MKIAYYMVFKPIDHSTPSGDLIIGKSIYDHLKEEHDVTVPSSLRARWIYYKPHKLFQLFVEYYKIYKKYKSSPPDLWLSYHSYYKAPDLLGMLCSAKLGIPYVIFQGIYSTKRRKKWKTLPGFLLNKYVLQKADLVITNKKRDLRNLKRLLPDEKLHYIAPGIEPEQFSFNQQERSRLRKQYGIGEDEKVIVCAAMFRPGVKTKGISQVISSFAHLLRNQKNYRLLLIGDGTNRELLEDQVAPFSDKVIFTGMVKREEMYRYYSCGDIFAFPGIEEGFGMVYAEAQSCGLPCVGFANWGASEAIVHNKTGLLSPASKPEIFTDNMSKILDDDVLRRKLSLAAKNHIHENHSLNKNYQRLSLSLSDTKQ